MVPLSIIEAMTLYSGAFVLVDTNTSTGIHYIEMVTLYSGVFVLVEILILLPVYSWHPVLLLIVYQGNRRGRGRRTSTGDQPRLGVWSSNLHGFRLMDY